MTRQITGADALDAMDKLLIDVPESFVYHRAFASEQCEYAVWLDPDEDFDLGLIHPQAQPEQYVAACVVGNLMARSWGVSPALMANDWVSSDVAMLTGRSIGIGASVPWQHQGATLNVEGIARHYAEVAIDLDRDADDEYVSPIGEAGLELDLDAIRIMAAYQIVQDRGWPWGDARLVGLRVAELLGVER